MNAGGDKPLPGPRYVAAVKAQQDAKAQKSARRRPILRLVWDADDDEARINALLAEFKR